MDVFALLFILSFISLLTTLVVLHIRKRIDKSNQSNVAKGSKHLSWISTMLGKQESSRRESYGFTKEKAARISLNTQKAYTLNYETGSGYSSFLAEVNDLAKLNKSSGEQLVTQMENEPLRKVPKLSDNKKFLGRLRATRRYVTYWQEREKGEVIKSFSNLVESNLKQDSDGNIEFIDCKWVDDSMMKREVNETQEKWKETVPHHKTRVKNRSKRQRKK
jgi:hypothetical protein